MNNSKKDLSKRLSALTALALVAITTKAQDLNFSEVENKITSFVTSALTVVNVVMGLFCLFFFFRIIIAYFGGGEDGRQDAGGMFKKLIIGVIIWFIAYQVVDGIFGTNFAQ